MGRKRISLSTRDLFYQAERITENLEKPPMAFKAKDDGGFLRFEETIESIDYTDAKTRSDVIPIITCVCVFKGLLPMRWI
jgi:hypothetical protein